MTRRLAAGLLLLGLHTAPVLCAPAPIVDARGERVELAAAPQRIVSLLPALTEAVCALGACERLVGVDRYSNWPAPVRALPQVGGGLDPSVEAIIALRPDLVLAARSSRVAQRLQTLGLKVAVLEPTDHADIERVLIQLGQLLDMPTAARVWRDINARVDAAARTLPAAAQGMRVYFEVGAGPYAAGENSFIGQTLARLHVRNVVPAALGPFPKLSSEFVLKADPDLIMLGERNAQRIEARPGWDRLRAVRGARVCRFSPGEMDLLVRPGPRMGEAAQLMAHCLTAVAGR